MEARRKDWARAEEGRDEDDYRPDMPPLHAGEYLLNYLYEIGPTLAAGMGASPITFSEIDAWCRRVGIDLRPWESRTLRRLSCEYVSESHKATKMGAPAPWLADGAKPEPSAAQLALRALAKD